MKSRKTSRSDSYRRDRLVLWSVVAVMAVVFFTADMRLGYYRGSPTWTHFSYSFQHASFLHLLLNAVSLVALARSCARSIRFNTSLALALSYVGAVIASFIVQYDIPTVGASAMVYFLVGLIVFSLYPVPKRYRLIHKSDGALAFLGGVTGAIFLLAIILSFVTSAFSPRSATCLHAVSMALALPPALLHRYSNKKNLTVK